jgi:hypothetical protein
MIGMKARYMRPGLAEVGIKEQFLSQTEHPAVIEIEDIQTALAVNGDIFRRVEAAGIGNVGCGMEEIDLPQFDISRVVSRPITGTGVA